jgi:spore germination cell wall hydrolase CwlJ-like protein
MARKKSISSRLTKAAMRRWQRLRQRVGAASKGPWIFLSLLLSMFALFGFAWNSTVTYQDERRTLTCLALNVYHEARGEPEEGQYAVAEVTMNRVASRFYPDTVCGVVYEKRWDALRQRYVGAFSWTEFDSLPPPKDIQWQRAQEIAEEVYFKRRAPVLVGALFYHANYIRPSWALDKQPVARIGRHIFYN